MKTPLKFLLFKALALMLVMSSCSKEDVGPPGKDGNANIATFIFDTHDKAGSVTITMPELNKDALENDLILVYVSLNDGRAFVVPNMYQSNPGEITQIVLDLGGDASGGYLNLYLYRGNVRYNFPAGLIETVKVIIGKSTSTDTRSEMLRYLENSGLEMTYFDDVSHN